MITPILQSDFLWAQDMRVPVESFSTAITDMPISCYELFDDIEPINCTLLIINYELLLSTFTEDICLFDCFKVKVTN